MNINKLTDSYYIPENVIKIIADKKKSSMNGSGTLAVQDNLFCVFSSITKLISYDKCVLFRDSVRPGYC